MDVNVAVCAIRRGQTIGTVSSVATSGEISAACRAPPREPLLTRAFGLLVTGHFLQALGYASMVLFPLYLHDLGASRTRIGTIMAAASVGGLLFRPVVGWSLDTVGRRATIAWGTLLSGGSLGLVWFVVEPGYVAYGVRVLFGIGAGTLITAYFTLAADLVPSARRTQGIALFGISGLVPLVVNPFAGELGLESSDLRWFFPVVGAIVLLSVLPIGGLAEPPRQSGSGRLGPRAVLAAIGHRSLWSVWIATATFTGLLAALLTFTTVTAARRGVDQPAGFWLTYVVGATAVRLIGGSLPDRLGSRNLVAPAVAAFCVATLVAAGAESSRGFLAAGLIGGVGHGYAFPVLVSQVVERTPASLRGSAVAMFTALAEVSTLVLTPLFGHIGDRYDDATMFAAAAVTGVAGLGMWCFFERGRPHPPIRSKLGG